MNIRYYVNRSSIWLDFKDAAGKRRRVPSGCATLAEAKKAAPAVITRVLLAAAALPSPSAGLVAGSGVTIEQAFDRCIRERESWITSKDRSTLRTTFENLGLAFNTPVSSLTRASVLTLRTEWLKEPGKRVGSTLSASTINHRLSMLSALLDIEDLPPHTVKHLSTKGNERKRRISNVEIQKGQSWLCANAHLKGALDLCDLITVGLESCARLDEWLSRPWSDVVDDMVTFRDTKNGETRTVPLTPAVQAVLRRRSKVQGGPFSSLNADRVTALWKKMREGLGLAGDQDFVFHGLRHEGLSRLADNDVTSFTIQSIAGHASVVTTQKYVKGNLSTMSAAMNKRISNDPV